MACKWYGVCPLRRFEEQGLLTQKWAEAYCESSSNWIDCKRYQSAERGAAHPDSMLPDGTIDERLR